ncbi:MAG: exodeoxyribonuclease VII large subunit [candidate division KSB1 bacterium]|nr:exodeoxyribonuclease VII large subunit [candidate division KSB1 bacterium]MDZ7333911.1 exodeoxyribonuclease VII large subunit [candidate division KSB1 bacterium]MDZ7358290.1 exodeoxyribonuclease VII large subunit [candidate division KSB1 bacterium]MDZ7399157.1 exodeoxyribonuclease VII large subunit [candidate division KSB1 bacterium]
MDEIHSELAPEHIYSVGELTREIKLLLETTIPIVWVMGEISNLKFHSSGHLYFSLKDRDSQLVCVMWRSRNIGLFFTPQDGMKVLALGKVTVYEKRGYYQFDVIKMQPAGIGELQMAFERLKNKLQQEGLFRADLKKPLPAYPWRIGIVTSPTGAAIQDLVNILNRRFPGIEIILRPVKVQGEGAADEIAMAIDEFNEYGQVDVLIVGRGGGSLEDLWAFNEEAVARAIFRSKIPIISAVGHEVDFSISDFVADLRAPTPSAAAELAVPDRNEVLNRVLQYRKRIVEMCASFIQLQRDKLNSLITSYNFLRTPDLVRQYQQRLDELTHSLQLAAEHRIQLLSQQVHNLSHRLQALAPESVLKRGYSICYRVKDHHVVTHAHSLQVDDQIRVQFYRGQISGKVEQVMEE